MVTRVEFTDGSVYDVTSQYKKIKNLVDRMHFGEIDKRPPTRAEVRKKEQRLREFAAELMRVN